MELELIRANDVKFIITNHYMKVRDLVPNYLDKQIPFIFSTVSLYKSLIISRAFDEGIIKDDKTRNKFIYNGVIFK